MCVIPEIYLSQERREGSARVNCTKVDKERSCRKSLDQLTDPTATLQLHLTHDSHNLVV